MPDYEAWNRAIASYFTAGVPMGNAVFLSVDGDALEEIAFEFLDITAGTLDTAADFVTAVRDVCVQPCGMLDLQRFRGQDDGFPSGVGFLAHLVLAANRMQDDNVAHDLNYFLRLREILGIDPEQSRPEGLPAGAEEPLWLAWNRYLALKGFLPTAERGEGPQKFLRYIISQAILRECDKDYLLDVLRTNHVPPNLDCDQIGFWLARCHLNRRHLRDGIHHPDPTRKWEFYSAAHRLYESEEAWNAADVAPRRATGDRARTIEAGLYREESLFGSATHYLFPRQPSRSRAAVLDVSRLPNEAPIRLEVLRPGFFVPPWEQEPFCDAPIESPISRGAGVRCIRFPNRDFWLLTVDPENPQGAWATWKRYVDLGELFMVLCRPGEFDAEMQRFKEAALLDWEEKVVGTNWVEYHGCMVLSYEWGAFIPNAGCRTLADALTPRSLAGVSLLGGLRDPNQNAWIEDCLPCLKVYGFDSQFEVRITSSDDREVFRDEVTQQEELSLPDLSADQYMISVGSHDSIHASRMFRIIGWDQVQAHQSPEPITNASPQSTAGLALRGPLIVNAEAATTEVSHV